MKSSLPTELFDYAKGGSGCRVIKSALHDLKDFSKLIAKLRHNEIMIAVTDQFSEIIEDEQNFKEVVKEPNVTIIAGTKGDLLTVSFHKELLRNDINNLLKDGKLKYIVK